MDAAEDSHAAAAGSTTTPSPCVWSGRIQPDGELLACWVEAQQPEMRWLKSDRRRACELWLRERECVCVCE